MPIFFSKNRLNDFTLYRFLHRKLQHMRVQSVKSLTQVCEQKQHLTTMPTAVIQGYRYVQLVHLYAIGGLVVSGLTGIAYNVGFLDVC